MRCYRLAILGALGLFISFWCLTAQSAFGQLSATGLDQFGTFQRTPIQTINLASLNNHIEIELFGKKERGNNFDAKLVWDFGDALSLVYGYGVPPSCCFYQVNGPTLKDITNVYVRSQITATGTCIAPYNSATTTFYSITDQNNTVHTLVNGTSVTTGQDCNAGTLRTSTIDGQWLLTVTYTNQNCSEEACITSITETGPDGNIYSGSTVTDPNGNQISASSSFVNGTTTSTWTDPTGTTPFTAQYSSGTAAYSYPLPTAGSANVKVTYLSGYTLQNNFGCPVQGYISSSDAASLPSSISLLADGSSYSFVYESADGTYPSTKITGRIHSITIPTGGTYTYTYSGGTNGIDCGNGLPVILTITGSDGSVWTYNRTPGTTTATTVTDPACNDTVYSFPQGGLQADVQSYQGTSGTTNCPASTTKTLLRTITTCYNGNYANCTSQGVAPPVSQVDQYTYLPNISQPSLVETLYNSSELPTQVSEFDFGVNTGSAPSAAPLRATKMTYANIGNNILNRPSCVQVTVGASPTTCGTVTSATKSITNYSNYGSTGNVGTIQNWVSGTSYASRSFTYYSTGLINTATDPMGNITTYTYAACNNSYLTGVAEPLSLSTSMTWDCNGGVPLSNTDENTNTTNYSYVYSTSTGDVGDPFWRLRSTTYPDGGTITTTYNDTASPPNYVTSILLDSAGDTVQTQVNLDGQNRPYQRITSDFSGGTAPVPPTVEVDTTYDVMGRILTVSNPYTPPASPSGNISYYYDALGRQIKQINQDGSTRWWCFENVQTGGQPNCNTHKTSVAGDWVDFADEDKNDWQNTADGLGRIAYVFEPGGGTPSGTYQPPTLETDYQYDALGNVLSVAQKGKVGTDTARPTRSFSYDGLSRLTSSNNPESGTTTYVYDDVNGKIMKTAPAPNEPTGFTVTATYAYDGLNRITSKSYSDSLTAKTPTSCYLYGTPTNYTSGANQKGRLMYEWTQSASAGSCPSALPSSYLTMKYFTYDLMGRPNGTQQQQCSNGMHCVASSPYALSLTYNASGSVSTLTNPVGNSGNPLTLTYSYDAGGHLMTLQSDWTAGGYPATLYSLNTSSSNYGYNAYGPTNWCFGASCSSSPPLNITQGYDPYRLRVNNISVIGQVP